MTRSARLLKQPFYLHSKDPDQVLPLAGLYEFRRNKDNQSNDPDAGLITVTIITTHATNNFGHIHDQLLMTVRPEHFRGPGSTPHLNKADNIPNRFHQNTVIPES